MPQEFQVLRCCSCDTFQVQQVKKATKWNCKLCGCKQSRTKVFGQGSGKDCRIHVQQLNSLRGDAAALQEAQLEYSPCHNQGTSRNDVRETMAETVATPGESRWKQYEEVAEGDDEEEVDDVDVSDNYTTNFNEFQQHRRMARKLRKSPYSKPVYKQSSHNADTSQPGCKFQASILLNGENDADNYTGRGKAISETAQLANAKTMQKQTKLPSSSHLHHRFDTTFSHHQPYKNSKFLHRDNSSLEEFESSKSNLYFKDTPSSVNSSNSNNDEPKNKMCPQDPSDFTDNMSTLPRSSSFSRAALKVKPQGPSTGSMSKWDQFLDPEEGAVVEESEEDEVDFEAFLLNAASKIK